VNRIADVAASTTNPQNLRRSRARRRTSREFLNIVDAPSGKRVSQNGAKSERPLNKAISFHETPKVASKDRP
jgi:hypothetical protein